MRNLQGIIFFEGDFQICISVPLSIGQCRRKCEVDNLNYICKFYFNDFKNCASFVLAQMSQAYAHSCDKSNTFMVIIIKKTTT